MKQKRKVQSVISIIGGILAVFLGVIASFFMSGNPLTNLLETISTALLTALIVSIWMDNLPVNPDKLKHEKGEYLVSDKMLSEHEKQKIRDEIYMTANGTVLNSEPHTFKDFINNQKLPSKLELIWEILADNNLKISDIIKLIESGAPYPMNTKVTACMNYLKITSQQLKMIQILNMYNDYIKIDDNYPLYIEFTDMRNYYDNKITVLYQAGDRHDDKNPSHERHTRPTKY